MEHLIMGNSPKFIEALFKQDHKNQNEMDVIDEYANN